MDIRTAASVVASGLVVVGAVRFFAHMAASSDLNRELDDTQDRIAQKTAIVTALDKAKSSKK